MSGKLEMYNSCPCVEPVIVILAKGNPDPGRGIFTDKSGGPCEAE